MIGRGLFLFLTVSFFSVIVWGINHQEEIKRAQSWADSFDRPYPILIFDRDITNFLIKSENATDDENKRFEVIKSYMATESGIELSRQDFIVLDTFLTTATNSALAMPILKNFEGEYKFCAVFANAPNGNSQVESNRITGFEQADAYKDFPDFNYNNLITKMSFEELYLFSLYHEVGHCLDETFLAAAQSNGGSAHDIHEAEIYAEILAYFALTQRLGKDVAISRALYRTIYSRVVGDHLTTQPSFGDPNIQSGGAIYNLGPYLLKALELAYFKEINLETSLDKLAKEFVVENSLNSREFQAIVNLLKSGPDKTIEQYRDWAFKNPQFFYSAYMEVVKYEEYTKSLMNYAFDQTPEPEYEPLPELNTEIICQLIQEKNLQEHLRVLNDYRSVINNGLYKTSKITEIYNVLNSLSFTCRGDLKFKAPALHWLKNKTNFL